MYKRILDLPRLLGRSADSFFLWGPRQTGKSSLLQNQFPKAKVLDLLKSDTYVKYSTQPHLLREELALLSRGTWTWTIIDEIQKVPALLDEVHALIETKKFQFALCGSSARKLRRGHANLLGGRALRYELHGLCYPELGAAFNLVRLLNRGYLPAIYDSELARDKLRAYCADYLKEEIAAEGLVRNLPSFAQFLELAALTDTEQVNYATFARDTGVSAPTIKTYFEILEDTMIGKHLPAYRSRPKRRIETTAKFYFFDVGVVGHLSKRGAVEPRSELFGKAFENWVHHELRCYQAYRNPDLDISYWRTSSGFEVDFVLGKMQIALEAKATTRARLDHFKGLRAVSEDYPTLQRRILICLEDTPRITDDGIEVWPYQHWAEALWSGELEC